MSPRRTANQTTPDPIAAAIAGLKGEDAEKDALRKRVADLERQVLAKGDAQTRLTETQAALELLEREFDIVVRGRNIVGTPDWLTRPPKSKTKHHGIGTLFLSDLHLDEVVNPAEVNFVNSYNREIAELRLAAMPANFIKIFKDAWGSYINYDGVVVPLGGDIFTGEIHSELTQTNADTMLGSFYHWIKPMASLLTLLAEEFGKVHVPVVVGNHSRRTMKPRAKFRARDNFDWLFAKILADNLHGDKRITFNIPDAADCRYEVYDQKVLLSHGDQVTGGAGIGGIWPPIKRFVARKRAQYDAINQPINQVILGHWHQLTLGGEFIVNSSLKGFDEYAMVSGFSYEVPQQAAWLTVPERGTTWTAPIFCQDREAEGW